MKSSLRSTKRSSSSSKKKRGRTTVVEEAIPRQEKERSSYLPSGKGKMKKRTFTTSRGDGEEVQDLVSQAGHRFDEPHAG